jgi:hypothetical protein
MIPSIVRTKIEVAEVLAKKKNDLIKANFNNKMTWYKIEIQVFYHKAHIKLFLENTIHFVLYIS